MANYATLKTAIQAVIKQNGNNEITGPILQQSLLSMITSLGHGYQYMGVATPQTELGTPDQRVFYVATEAGLYGGVTVQQGLSVLKYDTSWSATLVWGVDNVPYSNSQNLVKSGGVADKINALFWFVNTFILTELDSVGRLYFRPYDLTSNFRSSYHDLTKTWTQVVTELGVTLTTSPCGIDNCVVISVNQALVLDPTTDTLAIIPNVSIRPWHLTLIRQYSKRTFVAPNMIGVVDVYSTMRLQRTFWFITKLYLEVSQGNIYIYRVGTGDVTYRIRDEYLPLPWSTFIQNYTHGESPSGVSECLIVASGSAFVFDLISESFNVISRPAFPFEVVIARNILGTCADVHSSVLTAKTVVDEMYEQLGFIPYAFIPGYTIRYDNGLQPNSALGNATLPINVSGLQRLTITKVVHNNDATVNGLAFYDENMQYISGIRWTIGETRHYEYTTISVPENATYMRASFFSDPQYGKFIIAKTDKQILLQQIQNLTEKVFVPNVEPIINSVLDAKRPTVFNHNLSKKLLNILFITDTHQGGERNDNYTAIHNMAAFEQLANEKFCDCAVHGGDIITDYGTMRNDAITWFDDSMKFFGGVQIPFLICRGNHDYNMKARQKADMDHLDWDHNTYYILQQTSPDGMMAYVAVTQSTWDGVSQLYTGTDLANERIPNHQGFMLSQNHLKDIVRNPNDPYGLYGYMDFEQEKIRVIITNDYYVNASFVLSQYISGVQLDWLTTAAFNFSDKESPNEWKIVMFSHNNYVDQPSLNSVINNFINNGGKFVGHIHGHQHIDTYTNKNGYNDIGVRSGFFDKNVENTENEYAFSVFTIDDNTIYETRFGVGNSRQWQF